MVIESYYDKSQSRVNRDVMLAFLLPGEVPMQILVFPNNVMHMINFETGDRDDLIAIFKIKLKSNGQETHSVNS